MYLWLHGIPVSLGSKFGTHWCRTPHQRCHIHMEISGITLARKYRMGVVDQAQLGVDTVQERVALLLWHWLVTPNNSGPRRNMQEIPRYPVSTKAKSLKSFLFF